MRYSDRERETERCFKEGMRDRERVTKKLRQQTRKREQKRDKKQRERERETGGEGHQTVNTDRSSPRHLNIRPADLDNNNGASYLGQETDLRRNIGQTNRLLGSY